jgi:hypothetical protein
MFSVHDLECSLVVVYGEGTCIQHYQVSNCDYERLDFPQKSFYGGFIYASVYI